ncbi:hypothetical protein H8959_014606, partial [Pygathrix nigripes]
PAPRFRWRRRRGRSASRAGTLKSCGREFKKCNMARGCLCCLKYMMFLFNLIFW